MQNNFLPEETHITDYGIFDGKKVLLRLDLNVPIGADSKIINSARIDMVMPTIKELSARGAKTIIITHLGEKKESLMSVANYLSRALPFFKFEESIKKEDIEKSVNNLNNGDILLLENIRKFDGEEENDTNFAMWLSSLGEAYINDAFSVSHREHASIVGIPNYLLSYFGSLMEKEINNLAKVMNPKEKCLLILGGAKISTKLPLIKRYLELGSYVFVGGALANNIFKAQGYEIGVSLYDKDLSVPNEIINHQRFMIPTDVILDNGLSYDLKHVAVDKKIVDCGKETIDKLSEKIKEMDIIIINGPVGLYEEGWKHGTEMILSVTASQKDAFTVVGGGDTIAVLDTLHNKADFDFISLGGGAMLTFLAEKTLPGIEAILKNRVFR